MSQLVTCPDCKKHLQVPDELIGKLVQCPECQQTFKAEESAPIKVVPTSVPVPKQTGKPQNPGAKTKAGGDDEEDREGESRPPAKKRRDHDDDDDDDDDDERDRKRRRRNDDDDDDDDSDSNIDVRRRSSRRRSGERPGRVQAIAIMMLIGGIYAIVLFIAEILMSSLACCLWPGTYYGVVMGILAIVRAASLLGDNAHTVKPPTGTGVMMIINIINGDIINLVLGILVLVFCNEDEVRDYLRG